VAVPDDLAALLLRVEAALDDDLTLASMAREAGYSPFHFHRRFAARLGETPAKHVARMRLERAAYLVAVTDAPLTDIGLAVGFQNHETFARAFRRRFGRAPSQYRRDAYAALAERKERTRDFRGDGCRLSEVRS
jgi:transcriptional regulator GlxA family with amidase domain